MSCLKLQVSFSLNFASLFSAMRNNSSVLFYLKLYTIWTKEAHQSAKFQTFNCSRKMSPTLYFDRLLLCKLYKISAKMLQRICLMTLKSDAKSEEKPIFYLKNDKNFVNFDLRTQKSLKNFHFDLSLFSKVYNFLPNNVQRSYHS